MWKHRGQLKSFKQLQWDLFGEGLLCSNEKISEASTSLNSCRRIYMHGFFIFILCSSAIFFVFGFFSYLFIVILTWYYLLFSFQWRGVLINGEFEVISRSRKRDLHVWQPNLDKESSLGNLIHFDINIWPFGGLKFSKIEKRGRMDLY